MDSPKKAARSLVPPKLRYYYELLKLNIGASDDSIKRAWRDLARAYHPDRNPDDPNAARRFQDIQTAYEILSDAERVKAIQIEFYESLSGKIQLGDRVLDIGSFFGLRSFRESYDTTYRNSKPVALLDTTLPFQSIDPEKMANADYWLTTLSYEEETSILDDPAWDMVEIMLGGRYSKEIYRKAMDAYSRAGMDGLEETPWYEKNLEGFYAFIDRDFVAAARIYSDICAMIPNNIIFLYRHGLAMEAFACCPPELGGPKTTRSKKDLLLKAAARYREALDIVVRRDGMEMMKCVAIRKALADCLEHAGKLRNARRVWKEILELRPDSVEAKHRIKKLGLGRIINPFSRDAIKTITSISRKQLGWSGGEKPNQETGD